MEQHPASHQHVRFFRIFQDRHADQSVSVLDVQPGKQLTIVFYHVNLIALN